MDESSRSSEITNLINTESALYKQSLDQVTDQQIYDTLDKLNTQVLHTNNLINYQVETFTASQPSYLTNQKVIYLTCRGVRLDFPLHTLEVMIRTANLIDFLIDTTGVLK